MQLSVVQRMIGVLLMLFSLTMLPPALVSWYYHDGATIAFLLAFILIISLGFLLWLPVKKIHRALRVRDGFFIVVMFWTVLGITGALPFLLFDEHGLSLADAVFESMSGLTTTGATVITGLDILPKSILYYRQQLQWFGGMGIVVLAVAVLPMLGIGGMQLYRAETPGPIKDSKLTPRIKETAKVLWYIYVGLTIACTLAYWAAGMSLFDAIGHAFSTIAIGGFSTHDASIGFFDSRLIEWIAVIFLILSGANFSLHYFAWHRNSLKSYWHDSEFRFYIKLLSLVTLVVTLTLYFQDIYHGGFEAFGQALFHTVSIATTAGFTTTDYSTWPAFVAILLLLSSFVGGCAGSTGGGIKVIRVLLLIKQGLREIYRLIHPRAQIPVRIGDKVLDSRTIAGVWGFFALYVASFVFMYLLLALSGLDLVTAFSAVAATINNLGPGLGEVSMNYASINEASKWVLCFSMLLGRLEIFTLLVLLVPAYWQK